MPKIMHKGVSYGGGGYGGGDNVNHVKITQAEYDALVEAGKVDSNVVYFIPDGEVDEMLMSNMLVPDYANAQDITSPFTAPCPGYVMITALASRAEGGLIAYVYPTSAKESEVLISSQTYTNSYASSIIPLSKDNHIVFSINDGTIKTAKWVPAKNVVDDDSLALGRTDISGIGDGTVTGAIGALNNKIKTMHVTLENVPITVSVALGYVYGYSGFTRELSGNASILSVGIADWSGGSDIFNVTYDSWEDKLFIMSHTSQTLTRVRLYVLYIET